MPTLKWAVAQGEQAGSGVNAAIVINKPAAGVAVGDYLISWHSADADGGALTNLSGPFDAGEIAAQAGNASSNYPYARLAARVATSTDAAATSWTFNDVVGSGSTVVMMCITAGTYDASNPITVSDFTVQARNTSLPATQTSPAMTGVNGQMMLALFASDTNNQAQSYPSAGPTGMTLAGQAQSLGRYSMAAAYYQALTASGDTGTKSTTPTLNAGGTYLSNGWIALSALINAPSGPKTVDKTGGGAGRGTGSGVKTRTSPGTITKTGAAAIRATGSGAQSTQRTLITKTGGGAARGAGSGAKLRAFTFTKSGSGAPRVMASAFKFVGAPLRKTGGGAPRAKGAGVRTIVRAIRNVRSQLDITSSAATANKRTNVVAVTDMQTQSRPFMETYGRDDPPPGSEVLLAPYVPVPRRGVRVIAQRIITGEFLDWDVPVKNLEIDYNLSGPKLIKGTIGPESDDLRDINLDPWGTWLHVEENNIIRASGILLPVEIPGEFIAIEAQGVSAYPNDMPWRGVLSEVQIDPLEVVRRIWAHLQSYPEGRQCNVTVSGTTSAVRLGDAATTETVTNADGTTTTKDVPAKPYELNWWEAPDCGSEIDSLAKSTPFDWIERDQWNSTKTAVNHYIDLYYPRAGRRLIGPSAPRFVQNENMREAAVLSETPDLYASEVLVLGKGEGSAMIRGEVGLRNTGRLRRVAVVSDPAGISTSDRAIAIGRDELARRAALLTIGDIVIESNNPLAPVGSFNVGDDVLVEASIPYHGEVALWHRVIGYTWSPDTESMAVSLRRTEQFGGAGG